ncbi:MAG: hypothetical protein NT166_05120 [Candidatus Aminicenantes bacterium]|nr:hypothetical protein [Candidatus Aminicenantes bacterium]
MDDEKLKLLQEKLKAVDIEQITKDVQPFLQDKQELDLWRRDFFLNIIESIEII